jgi:hypothetical protein
VHRGRLLERGEELVGIVGGDRGGLDRARALLDLEGAGEGGLHRDLLIQQHAHEQGERVVAEEGVGGGVSGDVKGHGSSLASERNGCAVHARRM